MTTGTFPWSKKWSNRPSKINLSFFFSITPDVQIWTLSVRVFWTISIVFCESWKQGPSKTPFFNLCWKRVSSRLMYKSEHFLSFLLAPCFFFAFCFDHSTLDGVESRGDGSPPQRLEADSLRSVALLVIWVSETSACTTDTRSTLLRSYWKSDQCRRRFDWFAFDHLWSVRESIAPIRHFWL